MSEYQFYEFRNIDKPLTETEMDEISRTTCRSETLLSLKKYRIF